MKGKGWKMDHFKLSTNYHWSEQEILRTISTSEPVFPYCSVFDPNFFLPAVIASLTRTISRQEHGKQLSRATSYREFFQLSYDNNPIHFL